MTNTRCPGARRDENSIRFLRSIVIVRSQRLLSVKAGVFACICLSGVTGAAYRLSLSSVPHSLTLPLPLLLTLTLSSVSIPPSTSPFTLVTIYTYARPILTTPDRNGQHTKDVRNANTNNNADTVDIKIEYTQDAFFNTFYGEFVSDRPHARLAPRTRTRPPFKRRRY